MDSGGKSMNKRIEQLSEMLSIIANIDFQDARTIILSTKIGREILDNNISVIYEQQTANLLEIAEELHDRKAYDQIVPLLTIENIINAEEKCSCIEKSAVRNYKKNVILKKSEREKCKKEWASAIAIKRQNQLNVRRIQYADKVKR